MKQALIFIVFSCILCFVFCQTGDNLKNLLTDLFTTNNYNKYVRPSKSQSAVSSTDVHVSFFLAGIGELNEISEKLTTTGYLSITWKDQYLTWNASNYGSIEYIIYPQDAIWKPDISLQNGFTKMKELGSSFVNVKVDYRGTVTWQPFEIFESHCTVDTKYFPFDEQTCDLVFVCWSYSYQEVNLTSGSDTIQYYDDFSSNGEWLVVGSSSLVENTGVEVKVTFSLTVKRKPHYFILNMMMPVLLLSVLNLFTFAIPCDSGERMSYSITVWLSFAVFLTVINANLPQSSNISVIAVYGIMQLFMTTIVVITSAIQLRINSYSEEKKIPKILTRFASACGNAAKICPVKCVEMELRACWKDVVSALDFVFFWSCFIVNFLITLICYCYATL